METPLNQQDVFPTERPAGPDAAKARARQIVVLKILVALPFAVLVPSPFGGWPPISLLLWGLIGDPRSSMEVIECIGGGGGLLAIYTAVLFGALTLARGVALVFHAASMTKAP